MGHPARAVGPLAAASKRPDVEVVNHRQPPRRRRASDAPARIAGAEGSDRSVATTISRSSRVDERRARAAARSTTYRDTRQKGTAEFPWFHPRRRPRGRRRDTGCIDERWTRAPAINLDRNGPDGDRSGPHAPRDLSATSPKVVAEAPTMCETASSPPTPMAHSSACRIASSAGGPNQSPPGSSCVILSHTFHFAITAERRVWTNRLPTVNPSIDSNRRSAGAKTRKHRRSPPSWCGPWAAAAVHRTQGMVSRPRETGNGRANSFLLRQVGLPLLEFRILGASSFMPRCRPRAGLWARSFSSRIEECRTTSWSSSSAIVLCEHS